MSKRFFRVGEGRTLNLPPGLVEGGGRRVSAKDVDHRRWNADRPKERAIESGVHDHVLALEVDRIDGHRTGEPFTRFVNVSLRNGDLVEIDEATYLKETGASSPAPASRPASIAASSITSKESSS